MTQSERKGPLLANLADIKIRWPQRGDRLFVPSRDRNNEAQIQSDAFARQAFMTSGYKVAGDALVEEALADKIARHDLIYPIVFCYRQFIELSLKNHISYYGHLAGADLPSGRKAHDLKVLLKAFRLTCKKIGVGKNDQRALIAVSKCILEFDRMDPTSFTFRYATDKKSGNPYPVSADRIDLFRLRDVMDGIESLFNGADAYFDEIASAMPPGF